MGQSSLDVGANAEFYSPSAALAADNLEVHGYEPVHDPVVEILNNWYRNNLANEQNGVNQIALCESDGWTSTTTDFRASNYVAQ